MWWPEGEQDSSENHELEKDEKVGEHDRHSTESADRNNAEKDVAMQLGLRKRGLLSSSSASGPPQNGLPVSSLMENNKGIRRNHDSLISDSDGDDEVDKKSVNVKNLQQLFVTSLTQQNRKLFSEGDDDDLSYDLEKEHKSEKVVMRETSLSSPPQRSERNEKPDNDGLDGGRGMEQQQEPSENALKLANLFATSLHSISAHSRSEVHASTGEGTHADEHRDLVGPLRGDEEIFDSGNLDVEEGGLNKARFHYEKHRRNSEVTDLATGKQGGARAHQALVRSVSSSSPKCPLDRRTDEVIKFFHKPIASLTSTRNILHSKEQPHEDELKTSMHGRLQVSVRDPSHNESSSSAHNSATHRSHRTYHSEVGALSVHSEAQQFRLEAVGATSTSSQRSWWSCLLSCLGCGKGRFNIYDDPSAGVSLSKFSMNNWVIRYLHWTFRSSFGAVVVSSAIAFFSVTTLFALGIWSIAMRRPTCLGGLPDDEPFNNHNFMEAFELSWTTFATVGYGVVYPGISTTEPDIKQCTGLTILVSLEAFCGMLFGSLCCAILFARVARVQSYAQVSFSDAIVIRYGCGLQCSTDVEDSDEEDGSDHNKAVSRIPCPIMEFRMVNRLFGVMGGEIMDATINTVASIQANQACPTIRKQANQQRRKKGKKGGVHRNARQRQETPPSLLSTASSGSLHPPLTLEQQKTNAVVFKAESVFTNLAKSLSTSIAQSQPPTTKFFDEDPTGQFVSRRIFAKLDVEPPDHPFFKRVWVVRHVLDEDSPLLKAHARQMVTRNGGYWPPELNTQEGVRAAILFEQILVSLNGTSNADANTVYTQKVYELNDIYVGYRFANMLYRDLGDESLQCDLRLLNDVTEQSGGGGEPLNLEGMDERKDDVSLAAL